MSDDDRDIDIESDDTLSDSYGFFSQHLSNTQNYTKAEKRAHHNALERKRRDHIKECFNSLRGAVPTLIGEKANRAQILKKTTECIQVLRRTIHVNQKDINTIKKQNAVLDAKIRMLQSAKNDDSVDPTKYQQLAQTDPTRDSSDSDEPEFSQRNKKMKTSYQA